MKRIQGGCLNGKEKNPRWNIVSLYDGEDHHRLYDVYLLVGDGSFQRRKCMYYVTRINVHSY